MDSCYIDFKVKYHVIQLDGILNLLKKFEPYEKYVELKELMQILVELNEYKVSIKELEKYQKLDEKNYMVFNSDLSSSDKEEYDEKTYICGELYIKVLVTINEILDLVKDIKL